MRLSAFILEKMAPILQEWEDAARSMRPHNRFIEATADRHRAQLILEEVVAALDDAAPAAGARTTERPRPNDRTMQTHADTPLQPGFNIDQLVCEYRALRASVLRVWLSSRQTANTSDMEDMRNFNEALDRSLAEAIAGYASVARRSQGIFLGVVGHDLRTPLQCLSLGAQFLMTSEKHDPQLIQLGSRMFDSASRMSQILDNLLDFTRSRIGNGLQIKPRPVDLAAVAEQVVDEFRFSNPGRVIHAETGGDVFGRWDGARLGQVYQNLIGNALQHGARDQAVTVRTSGDNEGVRIEVHNDGAPIPAEQQAGIFDPLRRYANWAAERDDQPSLGLGLYIVREIVNAHEGTVHVRSGAETGTTFSVWLPKKLSAEPGKELRQLP